LGDISFIGGQIGLQLSQARRVRLQFAGTVDGDHSLIQPSELDQCAGPVALPRREIGLQGDGPVKGGEGLRLVNLIQRIAEAVVDTC
jgi:hypothetical protein